MADLSNYTKLDVKLADVQNFSDLAEYGDVYYLATETSVDTSYENSDSYEYVHDEATWNASYANGVLKKYYEKYPEEDLWNAAENRAVNFNDRWYHGNIGNEAIECGATWASDNAQKLVIKDVTYYAPIFYGMNGQDVELFNDLALTDSTGQIFTIETVTYNGNCQHCWAGAINAPGAKWPWVCPSFDEDVDAKLIFKYEGKSDVYPWGDTKFGIGEDKKIWGCASVASEWGDDSFKVDANGEGSSFDISKFTLTLEHITETSEELLVLVDENVFAELKDDEEDVDLYVVKGEDVPVDPDQPGGDTPDDPTPDTPDDPGEDDKKKERDIEAVIDAVLDRKGIDTEGMTEAEKISAVTGMNFVDDEWVAAKKEKGTLGWYIPAGRAWEP